MPEDRAELIRLENAEIGYGSPLLPPLGLSVQAGQRLALLGPNGGGKSTLLKSVVGLLPLLSGRRTLPSGRAPRIGYVPQAHRADFVYPLSAAEVVLQGRYGRIGLGRRPRQEDWGRALAELEKVGMGGFAKKEFRLLSGGQRQRVLLARALAGDPELLALDEFTSDLDPAASAALLREVSALVQKAHVSALFVTHEISAAAAHATHVVLVDSRRAIYEVGPSEMLLESARLSRLYGQTLRLERSQGKVVVFVETENSP